MRYALHQLCGTERLHHELHCGLDAQLGLKGRRSNIELAGLLLSDFQLGALIRAGLWRLEVIRRGLLGLIGLQVGGRMLRKLQLLGLLLLAVK